MKTTFFGMRERLDGAKWWTKYLGDLWGGEPQKKIRRWNGIQNIFVLNKELLVHLNVPKRGVPVDVVNNDQVSVHPLVITAVTGCLLIHCRVEMNPRLENTRERTAAFGHSDKQHWSFWAAVVATSFSACVVVTALARALVLRPPFTVKESMPAFSLRYTSTCFPLETTVRSPDQRGCP